MKKKEKRIKRQSPQEVSKEIAELLNRNNYVIYTMLKPKNLLARLLKKFIKVEVILKIIPRELLKK